MKQGMVSCAGVFVYWGMMATLGLGLSVGLCVGEARGQEGGQMGGKVGGKEVGREGGKELGELYPKPTFYPPVGHPRVFMRPGDVEVLRQRARHPQNQLAWEEFQGFLAKGTDGVLARKDENNDGAADVNMDSGVLAVISAYAYDYALHGNEERGRRAIQAMRAYVGSVVYPPKDYNNTGQTVYTIGLVYDWCYGLLSDEDKAELNRAAKETAGMMEIGWPPVKQGNVLGHGPEGQIFRDLLCAAVAMYDEDPQMYEVVAGRFFSRMVEPKWFMYPAHMHHQGSHYANYRGQWEILAAWQFGRMGLEDVFGPEQRYQMYWTLYARRGDGQVLRDGDSHANNVAAGTYWASPFRPMFLAANLWKDGFLKMEARNIRPGFAPIAPRQNQACDAVEVLLFNDPELEARPLSELALTKYFASPKGGMIARTGWEGGKESGAVVCEMEVNEWYFGNHQHLDAGAFQIYYRGVLANDSGYYQAGINKTDNPANDGSSGYGSYYDVNYYKRSIAHNVVTVYDPAETFLTKRFAKFEMLNDGGQRMPNLWIEAKEHEEFMDPANGYRIATVLGAGFGPDKMKPAYTYLKGDLKHAYSAKMEAYERSFVFLNFKRDVNPAALVVFDRVVSADAAFKKKWLLHALSEPERMGNQTVIRDVREGYTGKLTVDTVLPGADDTEINVVEGKPEEVLVDGKVVQVKLRPGGVNEGHGPRIEVSPRSQRKEDYFLHVMQVGDHKPDTAAAEVRELRAETHVGVVFDKSVVLFGKGRDRVSESVAFTLPGEAAGGGAGQTYEVLVADLSAGVWEVRSGGKAVKEVQVTAEEGVAQFAAQEGMLELVKK